MLELVDEEHNPITSNEYLEQTLAEQEGFSEKITEKNRIRKLIKSFFTKGLCCALGRRADDERRIQNLNKPRWPDLKEECVE